MRKILVPVVIALVILIGGFYTLNGYIRNQKLVPPNEPSPYEATLSGKYICLPHKDTSGPQTLECAFGMQTADDDYYALDFNQFENSTPPDSLKTGDVFTASGTVTPVEMLNTDFWQKYPITGIFSVKEIGDLE